MFLPHLTMAALLLLPALLVMAVRITENPFRVRFAVTESAANTYTEVDLVLPVQAVKGQVQAIELMKVVVNTSGPDAEDGQTNSSTVQVVRDSQSAEIGYANENLIHLRKPTFDNSAINGTSDREGVTFDDLTDGDGNGEILLERTIHVGMISVGNAAAKSATGYLLCHLVELDGNEVAVQLFVDDA